MRFLFYPCHPFSLFSMFSSAVVRFYKHLSWEQSQSSAFFALLRNKWEWLSLAWDKEKKNTLLNIVSKCFYLLYNILYFLLYNYSSPVWKIKTLKNPVSEMSKCTEVVHLFTPVWIGLDESFHGSVFCHLWTMQAVGRHFIPNSAILA